MGAVAWPGDVRRLLECLSFFRAAGRRPLRQAGGLTLRWWWQRSRWVQLVQ
jgi:hypothetical protein